MDKYIVEAAQQLRHELHQMPELSLREVRTKQRLMDEMKRFENLQVQDCGLWFYVFYKGKSEENAIAFRADFDAVEGKDGCPGHFCGHDGHAAVLAGLGRYINETKPERSVYLIFQPAEETGEGARLCCGLLKEKGISEIYGFHNIPGFRKNSILLLEHTFACASTGLEICLEGAPSHAAYPENGKNPADIIAKLILMRQEFLKDVHREQKTSEIPGNSQEEQKTSELSGNSQEEQKLSKNPGTSQTDQKMSDFPENSPEEPAQHNDLENSRKGLVQATVVGVDLGSEAYGVSAGKGVLRMTLRGETNADFERLVQDVTRAAEEMAAKEGMNCKIRRIEEFPATENDPECVNRLKKAAESAGLSCIVPEEPFRWSEDFGWYLKEGKGAFFGVGDGEDYPQLHTENFEFPDGIIETVLEMYAGLI